MARPRTIELIKFHLHEWIMVILLMSIVGILSVLPPFERFIGKGMLSDLMYPHKENTIPFWAVQVLVLGGPCTIFLTYYFYKRDSTDLHHAILGLLFSVFMTAFIADAVKVAVGRPRPDFFWRCFPDGIAKFDNVTGNVECHGDSKILKQGRKSFPSGHTSWSFSGLGFLSLYLAGKLKIFDRKGNAAKMTVVLLPVFSATLIGLSRMGDYRHHWEDVFVGAFLGLTMAMLCFRQFFPAPYEYNAAVPFGCHHNRTQTNVDAHDTDSSAGQYFRLLSEENVDDSCELLTFLT